jgi:hypothetical protein
MGNSKWGYGKECDSSGNDMVQSTIINFAIPEIATPIQATSAAPTTDPTSRVTDPIAPPKNLPTVETMLLLSDAVPLSADDLSVNTQQPSYKRYNILKEMKMKVMEL